MAPAAAPVPQAHHRRLKQLRRSCEARLGTLDVPAGCSVEVLCERIGSQRGRPIHLIPVVMPATHPCGFWVATEGADFILYEANTSRTHQEHIVAHELAHMICCHRGTAPLDDASARVLFPDVDPELVRDMLRRSAYTDEQEQEAEVMASVVLERLKRHPYVESSAAGEGNDPIARIERSLTYRLAGNDRPGNGFRDQR
jgi:hypothetical protein